MRETEEVTLGSVLVGDVIFNNEKQCFVLKTTLVPAGPLDLVEFRALVIDENLSKQDGSNIISIFGESDFPITRLYLEKLNVEDL
jgi:hypothetical protein